MIDDGSEPLLAVPRVLCVAQHVREPHEMHIRRWSGERRGRNTADEKKLQIAHERALVFGGRELEVGVDVDPATDHATGRMRDAIFGDVHVFRHATVRFLFC